MNRAAIIILNWNSANDTLACINSLSKQKGDKPDIILVDNNSHDDSVARFQSHINTHDDQVHLIINDRNIGFAGGINTGIRYALDRHYQYIGTLNPDAIADEYWVKKLTGELGINQSVGIVTGTLAKSDKKHIDTTGEQFPIWGLPNSRGRSRLLTDIPKEPEYIFASTGGGFIARASMLQDIGMFDEKFFMYFEDIDLCFRAQLAGYKIRYIPDAIAYHKIGASSSKVSGLTTYSTFKNLPIMVLRNVPTRLLWVVLPRFAVTYFLLFCKSIMGGRGKFAIKGWLMSIRYLPHALSSRIYIQKNKRVSVKYISSIMLHDIPPEQTGLRKFRRLFIGK